MALLFPRLERSVWESQWNKIKGHGIEELKNSIKPDHPNLVYAQTGGSRISLAKMDEFREAIVDLAKKNGFPDTGSRSGKGTFDADCAKWLYLNSRITTGEALRNETWAYITLVLLPDVCLWRFPGYPRDRFFGGAKNCFQRLWRRAFLLMVDGSKPEDIDILGKLGEEAWVQIIERTGISASSLLTRAIAKTWAEMAESGNIKDIEAVHRRAMKVIRTRIPIVNYEALSEDIRELEIMRIYSEQINE